MTNKRYTDEEIKSSLEVIATSQNCNECKIRNGRWGTCNCSQIAANAALDLINRQRAEIERLGKKIEGLLRSYSTAEVTKIKHGKWIETQEPLGWCDVDCAECSVCHESWIIDEDSSIDDYECMWHYCPNCGAKMDGGKNNA
jgi:hypothetical protein